MYRDPGFGAPQRDADGFLRSISAPALALKRSNATKSLMRTIPDNNVTALRQLALQADAELTGIRAVNRFGQSPYQAVAYCQHFVPSEQDAFRKQLTELPQLLRGRNAARSQALSGTLGETRLPSRVKPTAAVEEESTMSEEEDSSASSSSSRTKRASKQQATQDNSPLQPHSKTIRGREVAAKTAMTLLASTVGHADSAATAAFRNPRMLKQDPQAMANSLPAMTQTMRSRDRALAAATKNPKLLNVDATKFKKVVPVLNVLLGNEDEAAYCIATRPELLEVEQPRQLKDTVQVVSECVCSMNDAVWLVVQTIVPPSIRLTAVPFAHEAVQGEYVRMKGVRLDSRPVYRKPASSMVKQFGPKAKDMFLAFTSKGPGENACWTVTPSFDKAKLKIQLNELIGKADSLRNSPDQVPLGDWQFQIEGGKPGWQKDMYVKTVDAGRRRGPPLLLVPPAQIRSAFDVLQEALGLCWRDADTEEGKPLPGSRFIGCFRKGDRVWSGDDADNLGLVTLQAHGDFTVKNGYNFLRLPASGGPSEVSLKAWESMWVYLLYLGDDAEEVAEEAPPEPVVEKGKGKAKPPAAADAEAAAAAAVAKSQPAHVTVLEEEGWWRLPDEAMKLPELKKHILAEAEDEEDDPPQSQTVDATVAQVWVRSYHRGRCVVPVPSGPRGPPLVFMKPMISALSGSNKPCDIVKAKPGAAIYHSLPESAVTAADAKKPIAPHLELKGVGDVGYSGYRFFRAPQTDQICCPEETQMRIDTSDRGKVILAWFRVPALGSEGEAEVEPDTIPQPQTLPELPAWVDQGGWKPYEPRLPVVLVTERGEEVTSEHLRIREFDPCQIKISGSGPEWLCVVFWLQTGPTRRNNVKDLLFVEPGLFGAVDLVSLLWQELRVELGDALARKAMMDPARMPEWAHICQAGTEEELLAWIYERKIEAFGAELRGVDRARDLIKRQPALAEVTAPLLTDRCRELRERLGGTQPMLKVVTSRPDLLAGDSHLFPHALQVLEEVFDKRGSQSIATEHPELLTRGVQIEALFARLKEHFPEVYEERLRGSKAVDSEWARWRGFLDEPSHSTSLWMGRIAAEERQMTCQSRVKSFGTKVAVPILSSTS